jgi:hypothetical protein
MNDLCPIKPRGLQRQVQRFRDLPDLHRCTELPGDDVARKVVQYRAEVKPAPADDLEIGEVGLPKLVWRRRLVLELVGGGVSAMAGYAMTRPADPASPLTMKPLQGISFDIGTKRAVRSRADRATRAITNSLRSPHTEKITLSAEP